jgi:hypothetical protein
LIGETRISIFSGQQRETALFRLLLEKPSGGGRSQTMMCICGEGMAVLRMEDSDEPKIWCRDPTCRIMTFAGLMALAAVVMGIPYATKKAPECDPDYKCWDRVAKLEEQVMDFRDEIRVCRERQNATQRRGKPELSGRVILRSQVRMTEENQVELTVCPSEWRKLIRQICKGIREDLGPRTLPEPVSRQELRAKLLDLGFMIHFRRSQQYWRVDLPGVMLEISGLLSEVLPWAATWHRILRGCAEELREHGTSRIQ